MTDSRQAHWERVYETKVMGDHGADELIERPTEAAAVARLSVG